jgi:hypothetical protein
MGSKRYFAVNYVKPFSKNEKKKKDQDKQE